VDLLGVFGRYDRTISTSTARPARRSGSEAHMTIQVGTKVPDFKLDTYNPATGDFGSVSSEELQAAGRWTILFFYPADFTFV